MRKVRNVLGVIVASLAFCCVFRNTLTHADAKKLDILTIQPWYTMSSGPIEGFEPPDGIIDRAELLPAVASRLANKFPDFLDYTLVSQDQDILTSGIIEKLGSNQLVLWQGHGNWDEGTETVILDTGRDFDFVEYEKEDSDYRKAVDAGEIVQIDYYYEGITPKYVEKYTSNNLSGSLIFFGVCHSGHNSSLANILLERGASTIVASTRTLQMTYGNLMQYETVRLLGEINPTTNNYYTVGEALDTAKTKYGATDPGSEGELVIFGDRNYRINTISEDPIIPLVPNTGFANYSR